MTEADVLSIDLPWKATTRHRTAVAFRDGDTIAVVPIAGTDIDLVAFVIETAAPGALVLIDAPLDGCDSLAPGENFRRVDRKLSGAGIPILPSSKAGDRGPRLRSQILALRDDLEIRESYPYAVLRVLWAVQESGENFDFHGDASIDLSPHWKTYPPRYKRERSASACREAIEKVAETVARVPHFGTAVPSVGALRGGALKQAVDEIDALIGLVAAIARADESAWHWCARCDEGEGSIETIADGGLRRRFE